MINSKGEIKISDFGVSKDNSSSTTNDMTFTGTQGYLAVSLYFLFLSFLKKIKKNVSLSVLLIWVKLPSCPMYGV